MGLAVLLIYVVGVFVGNLIGRTAWRLAEVGVMKVPVVSAIYPAVKQITDFPAERADRAVPGVSAVVAVEPHEKGIWSDRRLVTGPGLASLSSATGQEMITVFRAQQPDGLQRVRAGGAAGESVIELPLKVEEAMRPAGQRGRDHARVDGGGPPRARPRASGAP